jgi:NAD+ kinase
VKAVAIVPHRERAAALALARDLAARLRKEAVDVVLPRAEAEAAGLSDLATDDLLGDVELDLVFAIGGDGTMLRTVQTVFPAPTPVLGVNVGQLGYLSALEPDEIDDALPGLLAGDFAVSERVVVEVEVESAGPAAGRWHALNEASLEKIRSGHLVRLEVSIRGEAFTTYAADGIIVATPTGTTAYTFSVRGPIASPELECLVLTPVSPHMLFDRSLVLARDEELGFVVDGDRSVGLTVDGRELGVLAPGDAVRCRIADAPARVVARGGLGFHHLLKAKFGLPDR